MSAIFTKRLTLAKNFLSKIGSMSFALGEQITVMDKAEESAILRSVFAILCVMILDFELPNPGTSASRFLTILSKNSENSYQILRTFKSARSILIDSNPNFDTYDALKQRLISEMDGSRLAVDIMSTVKPLINDWLENSNISSFAQCLQWFTFPGHMNMPNCETYLQEGVTKMYEFENSLQEMDTKQYTTREHDLLSEWFPRSSLDDLLMRYAPFHSAGATAELPRASASLAEKYNQQEGVVTAFDRWVSYRLERIYLELDRNADLRKEYKRKYYGTLAELFPRSDLQCKTSKDLSPDVGTMVPKQWDKGRGITKGATHRAFQQAGCREAIRSYIRDFSRSRPQMKELLKHYTIINDSCNRELAKLGSLKGEYSTIDLSSASDSITKRMVEQWTKHSSLYEFLLFTRSKELLLVWPEIFDQKGVKHMCYDPHKCKSEKILCRKYAGMGNGITFTVESLIFLAITWAAIESAGGDPSLTRWLVWGDDIVVPTIYAKAVISRLQANGFTVNTDKSFTEWPYYLGWSDVYNRDMWCCYRESCGGEYISGVDVTPVRVPRTFLGLTTLGACNTPQSLASILDLYNEFDPNVYPVVRQMLKLEIDLHFVKPSDTCSMLISHDSPFLEVIGPSAIKAYCGGKIKPTKLKEKYWLPSFATFDSTDSMCLKTHQLWKNPKIRINGHNYDVGGVLVASYGKDVACGPVPSYISAKTRELLSRKKGMNVDRVRIFEQVVRKYETFKDREGIYAYYESLHKLARNGYEQDTSMFSQTSEAEMFHPLKNWRCLDNSGGVRLSKPKDLAWEPRVRF